MSESQNFGHKNGLWIHIKLRCHRFSDSGSGLAFRADYMDPTQEDPLGFRYSHTPQGSKEFEFWTP